MSANLLAIFYLISGVLFILALRGLSSPETSRQGNFLGILGMLIAIIVTFLSISDSTHLFWIIICLGSARMAHDSPVCYLQSARAQCEEKAAGQIQITVCKFQMSLGRAPDLRRAHT